MRRKIILFRVNEQQIWTRISHCFRRATINNCKQKTVSEPSRAVFKRFAPLVDHIYTPTPLKNVFQLMYSLNSLYLLHMYIICRGSIAVPGRPLNLSKIRPLGANFPIAFPLNNSPEPSSVSLLGYVSNITFVFLPRFL